MQSNPYEPPLSYPEVLGPPAHVQVRAPALGVLVLAAMMKVGCLLAVVPLVTLPLRPGISDEARREAIQAAIGGAALFFPNLAMVYGAFRARRGESYSWALTSAILASLPVLSPLLYCGIPFGIWMLIVLLRKDVRMAFAS